MSPRTITAYGIEYDVVWDGTMSKEGMVLLPPRDTKVGDDWTPPPRNYSWTGNHTKEKRTRVRENTFIGTGDTSNDTNRIGPPCRDVPHFIPRVDKEAVPVENKSVPIEPGELGWTERTINNFEQGETIG